MLDLMMNIRTQLMNGAVCGLDGGADTLQTYVGDPIELHLRMDTQVVSKVALLRFIAWFRSTLLWQLNEASG